MLVVAAVLLAAPSASISQVYDEYSIKAALLYNFSKFVIWPSEDSRPSGEFEICVYGRDPYGEKIDAVSEKLTKGRPISVIRYGKLTVGDCQIAFIGPSQTYKVEEAIAFFQDQPVLTIAETPDFIDKGGMIGLVSEQSRVNFEINLRAARMAQLELSSQLLRVAKRVLEK